MKYWRIALGQKWNEKWGTHLFYYGYSFDAVNGFPAGRADDAKEYGIGVQYRVNSNTTFGLNYVKLDDGDGGNDDDAIRFRSEIKF